MSVYDDLFNIEVAGEEFVGVIEQLGENISFETKELDEDGNPIIIYTKMCVSDKSSRAKVSATSVYKSAGEMLFESREQLEKLRGAYFKREICPEKTFILASTTENPFSDKYGVVEVLECNEIVDIAYTYTKFDDETGNDIEVTEMLHQGVKVFSETSSKTPTETQVGLISNTVTDIYIPSQYPVTTSDTIIRKEFKKQGKTDPITMWGTQNYSIQNVDTTLTTTLDDLTFYGVNVVEVVKKI